jgi:hypothetical protein
MSSQGGTGEHQPRHRVGERFTREQHFESAAPVRPCREWGEAMDLEVIRPGKSPDDEIHERAGLGDPLRHAVIEVRVGVEQPHPARLRSIGVDGAVSPQRLKTG